MITPSTLLTLWYYLQAFQAAQTTSQNNRATLSEPLKQPLKKATGASTEKATPETLPSS